MVVKNKKHNILLEAKNRNELRLWLTENYNKEKECWVIVKRGRPQNDNTFWYIDAVYVQFKFSMAGQLDLNQRMTESEA